MEKQNSLKKKTISGLLWSFGDLVGNQGGQFIIQIVLARMLLPEDFGLIGMILIFVAISNSITDSGFTQALIREQKVTQTDYSTVFYFNIVVSMFIYSSLYLTAPAISSFYDQPQLTMLVRVLSLGVIANSFAIIPRAMFTKEVNFKIQAKVNLTASVVSGVIAIGAALAGLGVWSLVIRQLAMNTVQSLFLSLSRKWLPSLVFSWTSFKRLFGFGWKLLISGLIDTIYTHIFFLIIGKQYSAKSLGFYTNASKFSDVAAQTLTATLQRVTYPVLSSLQDDEDRIKQTFRKIIKLSGFLIFPVMAGIAAIADPLIRLVLGEQWAGMVVYFQLLCIAGMLYPIHALNLNILQVRGRSDLYLYLEIFKSVILSLLIFLAIWFKLGIIGLVGVIVLDSYVALYFNTYFSAREISYSIKDQVKDLLPMYLISLVMGAAVYIGGELLFEGNLLKLLFQISSGIIFYTFISKILKIKELDIVIDLLKPILKKISFGKSSDIKKV